jgi:hypothetical protein
MSRERLTAHSDSFEFVPADPRRFFELSAIRSAATRGTCPLRHASRPSVARSVADVLSAHGLRAQVPHIPAGFGGFEMDGNRKQRSCYPKAPSRPADPGLTLFLLRETSHHS